MNDNYYITRAIALSKLSVLEGGFPVGALIVQNDRILSQGISNGKQEKDATSHAEIVAIRAASLTLRARNLTNAILYSSMEPCLMCFSASYWAKITKVVFAASKRQLDPMHFEGQHSIQKINKKNHKQIEVVHMYGSEASALQVIKEWEQTV